MDLPEESISVYHIPRMAAFGLAARVNLFFGNYDAALENAEEALKLNNNLVDYNTFSFKNEEKPSGGINNRPIPMESPEMIMYRSSGFQSVLSSCCMSPELLDLFDTDADLRYKFNFTMLDRSGKPIDEPYPLFLQELDYNIGVPEMMLIKAECLARKKDPNALKVLDELREKRIATDKYTALPEVSGDKLLEIVLEERQRELVYNGVRFFNGTYIIHFSDKKRLTIILTDSRRPRSYKRGARRFPFIAGRTIAFKRAVSKPNIKSSPHDCLDTIVQRGPTGSRYRNLLSCLFGAGSHSA